MTDYSTESCKIDSLRDLQLLIPRLLKQVNADQSLALAAAANPLLLLNHLGYYVSDTAKQEIEERARFGDTIAQEYRRLQDCIYQALGQEVDLDNGQQLYAVIRPQLEGKAYESPHASISEQQLQRFKQALENFKKPELLQEFSDWHPVIPLLIQYRQLENRYPRFASATVFERILTNEVKLPITAIQFNLQERDRRKASLAS